MKKIIFLITFVSTTCNGQSSINGEMFVPIQITYAWENKVDWEDSLSRDIWFNIMNYSLTNPRQTRTLRIENPEEFKRRNNQLLFTRNACEFVVKDYVRRAADSTVFKGRFISGEGVYSTSKGHNPVRYRCVCLPAKMIAELGHGEQPNYRGYTIYLEPKPFVEAFRRFKLDSLDLAEAPYFTIFPVDINPSFDCSKAVSPVEKAICRSVELANLDRSLATIYRKALVSKADKVRESQRKWMEEREKACENKDNEEITSLLMEMYKQRIWELKQ